MMAVTSYFRTVVSDTPYISFFVLSFSYLVISSAVLTVLKCRNKKEFQFSWYQKIPQNQLAVPTDTEQEFVNSDT